MSNETDLDWLARNVHEWPKCIIDGEHSDTLLWIEPSKGNVKAAFSNNPLHCFDREQWLSRRTELQNKPSWEDVSGWVQWLAQDEDGEWFCYEKEPSRGDNLFRHASGFVCYAQAGCVLGDWRDTMEQRPVDAVQLEQPAVVAGTGAGSEPDANTCAALIADTLIRLRDCPDHFSAHELADLRQLCDAELTRRDAVVCGGQKYLDAHWFERGELPPVGVECTAVADGIPDANCVIVAISTDQVVVKWTENQMFDVLEMPGWSFRPIRTEREAAVSEMMAVAAANWGNLEGCCEALYDAGYRKGEK